MNGAQTGALEPAAESARPSRARWALRLRRSPALSVLALCVAYFLVVTVALPDMANPENLRNVASNMMPILAVAIGQTFVLLTGGIDLSVTATIALASVTGAYVMTAGAGVVGAHPALLVPAGILAMLLVGAAVGLLNGLAVTRLRMPPFMVTLTVMMFVGGLALWATQSKPIHGLPGGFLAIAQGELAYLPAPLFVSGALAVAAHLLLGRTVLGRWLYAVGGNAQAARVSGVPVARATLLAYVGSGLCGAAASVLYTGRLETGSPVLGQRIFLDVIGAAVIGGTSLFGGKGTIAGTAAGVLFITLIDDSFNLLGFSNFAILIAKGSVILAAALLDVVRARGLARSGR